MKLKPSWKSFEVDLFFSPLVQVIFEAVEAYEKTERVKWVRDWPGQTVLCVSQLYWTLEIHKAIKGGSTVTLTVLYINCGRLRKTIPNIAGDAFLQPTEIEFFFCRFLLPVYQEPIRWSLHHPHKPLESTLSRVDL